MHTEWTADLATAKELLAVPNRSCAICKGDKLYVSDERGIKPLLSLLAAGADWQSAAAADRVVGRAAAFLYILLRVAVVYAPVMSRGGIALLQEAGVAVSYDCAPDEIINRAGNGPCPMENAVRGLTDPKKALSALQARARMFDHSSRL